MSEAERTAYVAGYNDGWEDGRDPGSVDPSKDSTARSDGLNNYMSAPHYPGASMEPDLGIELNKEAALAFGNYVGAAPAIPKIDLPVLGAEILRDWGRRLAAMAAELKREAAAENEMGHPMLGLLLVRLQLSVEETGEWAEALASGDIEKAANELVDMSVVTDGHYLTLGLADLKAPLYREVHAANMSKLDPVTGKPIIDAAGRWVKGPAYRKPVLGPILEQAMAEK